MAALILTLTLFGVAGRHLSSASPLVLSTLVVGEGQNVSLTCNLTSCLHVTWYVLRPDQLLPLLEVMSSQFVEDTVNFYMVDDGRITNTGALATGAVGLEILEVEEKDAGLYFCIGNCGGRLIVDGGVQLALHADDEEASPQLYWGLLVVCVSALCLLCVALIVRSCLQFGRPAACCCRRPTSDACLRSSEDDDLHYSSLKFPHKPRPSGRAATGSWTGRRLALFQSEAPTQAPPLRPSSDGVVDGYVVYSAVNAHNNPNGRR